MLPSVFALAFPARCPGCGVPAEPLCTGCGSSTRPAPDLPVPDGLDALGVPFAYEGVVRELVARAKYRDRHAALGWLAGEMVRTLRGEELGVDVITWAPTTTRRRRERGFDQAELLATAIATELHLPVRARLRRGAGSIQTGGSRAARIHGPVFVAARPRRQDRGSPHPRLESVLLVDDVITTGATMRAAALALRSGHVGRIIGVAAARRA